MIVRNEDRLRLQIKGVIDGAAGVVGRELAFRPNVFTADPAEARTGILGNRGIRITPPQREGLSNLWTARFEYVG